MSRRRVLRQPITNLQQVGETPTVMLPRRQLGQYYGGQARLAELIAEAQKLSDQISARADVDPEMAQYREEFPPVNYGRMDSPITLAEVQGFGGPYGEGAGVAGRPDVPATMMGQLDREGVLDFPYVGNDPGGLVDAQGLMDAGIDPDNPPDRTILYGSEPDFPVGSRGELASAIEKPMSQQLYSPMMNSQAGGMGDLEGGSLMSGSAQRGQAASLSEDLDPILAQIRRSDPTAGAAMAGQTGFQPIQDFLDRVPQWRGKGFDPATGLSSFDVDTLNQAIASDPSMRRKLAQRLAEVLGIGGVGLGLGEALLGDSENRGISTRSTMGAGPLSGLMQ